MGELYVMSTISQYNCLKTHINQIEYAGLVWILNQEFCMTLRQWEKT